MSDKYVGTCIFVDHMSGYIHVKPQLGFSGSETIRAMQNYERMALNHGLIVESYLCDNGIFKGKAFVCHLSLLMNCSLPLNWRRGVDHQFDLIKFVSHFPILLLWRSCILRRSLVHHLVPLLVLLPYLLLLALLLTPLP